VYLFEKNVNPLTIQKHNRELEMIVQECILSAIRESIPTEAIIRAYLDESVEQEEEVVIEPIKEEEVSVLETGTGDGEDDAVPEIPPEEPPPSVVPAIENIDAKPVITRLAFNDVDEAFGEDNTREQVVAPKDIDRLEEISAARNMQRNLEEEGADDEDDAPLERIKIEDGNLDLGEMDITEIGGPRAESPLTLDFEEIA
jgi:hypothetical protein